jgi:MFS family permease
VPRARLIGLGWGVYALSYVLLAQATQAWHVWALFALYGTYYGLSEPVEKALVKDLAPEAVRGRAYGMYNFLAGIMALAAGLLTGGIWQELGAEAALNTGAAIALLAGLLLMIWVRPTASTAATAR